MAVPRQVKERAEKAEKLQKEIEEQKQAEGTPDSETDPAPDVHAEGTLEPQVEQQSIKPLPFDKDRFEKLEKSHEVLQGKYNAEVPRMAEEKRALKERVSFLEKENQLLKENAQPPMPPKDFDPDEYLSEEEKEEYGEDLVRMQSRVAQGETSKAIKPVQEELEKIRKDNFFDRLDDKVPDWEKINKDQGFLEWLNVPEGYSQITRQSVMDRAFGDNNVSIVARMFNDYIEDKGKPASKPNLENQVVPTKSPTGTAPQRKKVYKMSEITAKQKQLVNDKIKGLLTTEQYNKVQNEIDSAFAERRIIQG